MEVKKHFSRKMKILLLILGVAVILVIYFFAAKYINSLPKIKYSYNTAANTAVNYPDTNFAVISDIHYYDQSLGTEGAAFNELLQSDRKLLLDSKDLLDYTVDKLINSSVKFVIVSGDLTNNGELINHQYVAAALKRVADSGKKVFVVPGNHDILNPEAVKFNGDTTEPVDNISPEDFADFYYGLNDPISRDPNSLSYVSEAADNLWILGISSVRYGEGNMAEIVSGRVSQATENWIADMLREAQRENKAVIAVVHHNVVEHWKGQAKLHPDYLISDYKYFGKLLASYNVRVVFTGHYHAQDITKADFGTSGTLYDVETGSLVTAPCPVRFCSINNNTLNITTEDIVIELHPDTDFADNANAFVKSTVVREAFNTLRKYKVAVNDANYIAEIVGDSFVAHYYGDEDISKKPVIDTSKLNIWSKIVLATQKYVINGLWNDLPPSDNNCVIPLN